MTDATKRRRAHPEHDFQRVCFAFLTRALPEGAYVVSIDAAQKGSAAQRIMDARRGIQGGQLDMEILTAGFPPIKLELKVGDGQLSPDQLTTMDVWRRNGGLAFVAYTLDEIEAGLRGYGIPLRASAGGRWEHHLEQMKARAAKPRAFRKPQPRTDQRALKAQRRAGWPV